MPIKVKRVVHTGAKSQLGGLKEGLLTFAYQVSMEEAVAIPPIEPKATQTKMLIISLTVKDGLFILFIFTLRKIRFPKHKCNIVKIVYDSPIRKKRPVKLLKI